MAQKTDKRSGKTHGKTCHYKPECLGKEKGSILGHNTWQKRKMARGISCCPNARAAEKKQIKDIEYKQKIFSEFS
jgi:hypothetical protein